MKGITILTPENLPLFTPSGENPYIKAPNSYSYLCFRNIGEMVKRYISLWKGLGGYSYPCFS